jgi:hypothetical protein
MAAKGTGFNGDLLAGWRELNKFNKGGGAKRLYKKFAGTRPKNHLAWKKGGKVRQRRRGRR